MSSLSLLRLVIVITSIVAFASSNVPAQVDGASRGPFVNPANSVTAIADLVDVVAANHIAEPSRTDLMLAVLTAFGEEDSDADQAPTAASLETTAEPDALRKHFIELLSDRSKRLSPGTLNMTTAANALAATLPGGLQFVSPEERRVNEQVAANRYVGIGIQLATDDDRHRPVIPKVFEGGPAHIAGARDADIILSVDRRDTKDVSLAEVVKWLRGLEGTDVTVELSAPDSDAIRTYTMTRGVVPFASIEKPVYSTDQSIVGIEISRIAASTVHELKKLEAQLSESVSHVVFDLRNVAAHDLHFVELLASALIDGGEIGSLRTRSKTREFTAERGCLFGTRRLVMIVSPRSVPPAWWLAAAVVDTGTGEAVTEVPLPRTEKTPVLYQMETLPSGPRTPIPNGLASQYVRFATGELLRSDGRNFQNVARDFGCLSDSTARPPSRPAETASNADSAQVEPKTDDATANRDVVVGQTQPVSSLTTLLPLIADYIAHASDVSVSGEQ